MYGRISRFHRNNRIRFSRGLAWGELPPLDSFSPFYPGISTPRWTPDQLEEYATKEYTFTGADGKEKTVDAYAASQIQRGLEREIREWKRCIEVKKAAEQDITDEKKKLAYWRNRLKTFCDETGLRRQQVREYV